MYMFSPQKTQQEYMDRNSRPIFIGFAFFF